MFALGESNFGRFFSLTLLQLSILQENLREIELGNLSSAEPLTDTLRRKLEDQKKKLQAKDGVSQTPMRKQLRRLATFILSTKDVGMGVSRMDPYSIAPIVLGCIYGAAQFVIGATEESLIAMRAISDTTQSIAYWIAVEQHHIARNGLLSLKPEYDELSEEIVKMYKDMIILIGTILAYFDNKWRKSTESWIPLIVHVAKIFQKKYLVP